MRPPGPVELFRLLGQTRAAVQVALGAVPQLVDLVRELNALVAEARAFVTESRLTQQQAAELVAEVEITRRQVQEIADRAGRTETDAAAAVREVRGLAGDVQALLAGFEPALRTLSPVADFIAEEITVDDAEAFTALVHDAPELVDKLTNDVVPVLDSLDTVGADLREVVDTTQQMDEMLGAVPGLGRVRKRIAKQQTPRRPPVTSPRLPEEFEQAE